MKVSEAILVCILLLMGGAAASGAEGKPAAAEPPPVVFVCEHGNAKSLMAAAYFNRLAERRHLAFRAIARGVAPDSDTVPPVIAAGLKQRGVEVAGFHPVKIQDADLAHAIRVVVIGTKLPGSEGISKDRLESWEDVPPATEDFSASSRALQHHIEGLVQALARDPGAARP